MTDKQIIIHGVDVSGCSWYTQGATGMICADWHISNDCSKNPNCYYKNWKRKEQECEELKEELQKYKDREQWEIELNKKRADSFKEMRKMLYEKFIGNSLIEKRSPYGN